MKGNKFNILKSNMKSKKLLSICIVIFAISVSMIIIKAFQDYLEDIQNAKVQQDLKESIVRDGEDPIDKYRNLHKKNKDMIGWLKIDGTNIDYPVMQTLEDEEYYLYKDFYGNNNKNGSLILDTDSISGVGKKEDQYKDGKRPSTNLIVHGHTMKSGEMFGNLSLYEDKEYGEEHKIISYDTLYEERKYEVISVFYSQVFYKNEDVFKYYKFFQANTQEEFDYWYSNIKNMSIYDTGVTAELGDEFITLSCCSFQVEDGRFVVVGKRL